MVSTIQSTRFAHGHPIGFQTDDYCSVVGLPVNGDDIGAHLRGQVDGAWGAFDHDRDRDHKLLAKAAARIAGDGVGDFADQVENMFVAGVRLANAEQQMLEQNARRGKVNAAALGAGDADYAGDIKGGGFVVFH